MFTHAHKRPFIQQRLALLALLSTLFLSAACSQKSEKSDLHDQSTEPLNKIVYVLFKTNMGDFTVEVNAESAPISAANFLSYVNEGFYNNTIFHRVIDNFMVQGGGFDQNFSQKATHPPIQNEADNGLLNITASVAMARTSNPHSATSQFFINVTDNAFLNHSNKTPAGWGYAVFGRVTEGMETINSMKAVSTGSRHGHQNVPLTDIVVESATVVTPQP